MHVILYVLAFLIFVGSLMSGGYIWTETQVIITALTIVASGLIFAILIGAFGRGLELLEGMHDTLVRPAVKTEEAANDEETDSKDA